MGITLSVCNTVASKTGRYGDEASNVLLTRPAQDSRGCFVVTWRHTKGMMNYFGWVVPNLDPNTNAAFQTHGSFVSSFRGYLHGLGTKTEPIGVIPVGATLSLRYDPALGTMHARVNDKEEELCFTDLRNDLVPAVCLVNSGDSCAIVS
jgi:hypothetical protein